MYFPLQIKRKALPLHQSSNSGAHNPKNNNRYGDFESKL